MLTLTRLEVTGEIPNKRAAHAMAVHERAIWVFGGNCDLQFFNDMYTFDTVGRTWSRVTYTNDSGDTESVPSPRAGQSMESFEHFLAVFGGGNRAQFFGELYFFDIDSRKWEVKTPKGRGPSQRAGHSSVKISGSQCCIFGGGDLVNVFNDCFILDLSVLVWIQVRSASKVPIARAGHSGCYYNGALIVFGGGDVWGSLFSDLYTADFGTTSK